MSKAIELVNQLEKLQIKNLYNSDFYWTWDKTDDEIAAIFTVADALRDLRERNRSCRVFDSGLGISVFRDNSTRTRFSYASACNLLGLDVKDLDEKKSQIAHGETVRETANMISFMADVIGIRDDMFIGEGHKYMKTFMDAVTEGYEKGILEQRPMLVNLQCDVDHPTQSMADMDHIIHHFGGVENLKGKKIAMSWAYSPSYGKPLSVPQGVVGLMTRFGMEVVLAHPKGYEIMPDIEKIAQENAKGTGGSFRKVSSMAEAFEDADIVYPKSWAPFAAMEERTRLYQAGDKDGIDQLEKKLLAQNAEFKDWTCTEDLMKRTKNGTALYMHCLPADISGLSCKEGEVENSVFERYITPLYKQASYKPYIIAAMILTSKVQDPVAALRKMDAGSERKLF
ncbi:knotted carbamoyltransferase YgeW [Flexilinea flocculi]|jgi:knotted carbamoyltransferase YgeW|uniref:Knotted carbamoyltransferase YgeW n=1 Tax=Flexilinea flocculi TaxID=1678840 RepID=A0A0S7BK48_9CHLR|nr:knotted carbamoyltransferase YgeW [Flexilinea flocculi]GAP40666.1 knotted carbamoyltransferase YgeW [Flexilinea flocculi]